MATLSNHALRLQASLLDELRTVVEEEGTTINQFTNVAVAEELAALPMERYFGERAGRANRADFLANLDKAGTDVAIEGDKLPEAQPAKSTAAIALVVPPLPDCARGRCFHWRRCAEPTVDHLGLVKE